jgi:hypothetical protein
MKKLNGLHTEVTGKGYKIETHFTEGVRDGKETIWAMFYSTAASKCNYL